MKKRTPAAKLRRRLLGGGLAVLLAAGILYTKDEVSMSGNEATRFAVVYAVAEQNSFALDGEIFRTVDRVVRDGKVYSDKPPMLPFLLGLAYKIPHRLFGASFQTRYSASIYFLNLFAFSTINLLLFGLFFRSFLPWRGNLFLKGFLAFALCAGSWLFTYSVIINNHTPAALLLFVWFLLLEKFRRTGRGGLLFQAGLAAGLAGTMDIPTGILLGAVGLPVAWLLAEPARRPRQLAGYLAGGLLVAAANTILNYCAYGTIMPLYLGNSGSYSPGIGGKSFLVYAFETLIGRRGLFSYQPLLLFALPMLFTWKKLTLPERGLTAAGILILTFYLVFTNEYGGWAYGFRYAVAVIPVFGYLAARYLLPRCRRSRKLTLLAVLLGLAGIVTAMTGAFAPFANIYESDERTPAGSVHRQVRCSFTANLLTYSFERDPESRLTRLLIGLYGEDIALSYLKEAFFNTKNLNAFQRLIHYVETRRQVPE